MESYNFFSARQVTSDFRSFPLLTVSTSSITWLLARQCRTFNFHIEPCHEIKALFVLRKPILQARMRSHPVWLVG